MGLAIAYVWLKEDLYDKEYVATAHPRVRPVEAYVLGESDGKPKTPEWAEEESSIPAREIRALAREWGRKTTMLAAARSGVGRACRSATGNEFARHDDRSRGHAGLRQTGQQHLGHLARGSGQ